ncbi:MAG: glycerate kinase [Acidiferrobacter sp.]
MALGVERACPGRPVLLRPLPDGGDGTLEVLLEALGGERLMVPVSDACGQSQFVPFGLLESRRGRVALIESAQVVGLSRGVDCPFARRTTAGLGQLIRHALDCGARTLYIGLGGSATCDAGLGLLGALGLRFEGLLEPSAMPRVVKSSLLDPRLRLTRMVVLTDVVSPLLGPRGAALFAPQKGATPADMEGLDARLRGVADSLESYFGGRARDVPGSGAAGGLGFALALLGARLVPGAPVVARLTGLSRAMATAGLVLTGEGACDGQTAYGKGPQIVAALARRLERPVVVVCGRIEPSFAPLAPLFLECVRLWTGVPPAEALAMTVAHVLSSRKC